MPAVGALTLVLATLVGLASPMANQCKWQAPWEHIGSADALAYGMVAGDLEQRLYPGDVTFRTKRVLKGSLPEVVRVRTFQGGSVDGRLYAIAGSEYGATIGEHVLYLRLVEGAYQTDSCSGSHPGAPTPVEEVAALGALTLLPVALLALLAVVALVRLRRTRGVRTLAVLMLVVPALLGSASPAAASCVRSSLEEQLRRAEIVAFGTVADMPAIPPGFAREVTFRARAVLKGSLPSVARVRLGPAVPSAGPFTTGFTSVDYRPAPGDHVLYLRALAGAYETDSCSGSHPGPPTSDEQSALGAGVAPTTATLFDEFAALDVLPLIALVGLVALVALVTLRRRAAGGA